MEAPTNLNLTGKVAIVTGSSSGIGAATAILLARRGAQVVLTGRNEVKLAEVETQCVEASPEKLIPLIISGDVTDQEVRKALISKTVESFGQLDTLVNNAGANLYGSVFDATLEDLDKMLDVHVRAPFELITLAAPHLITSKGSVVNVSSILSVLSTTSELTYCIAKGGMDQLTKCSAVDLGPKGVRVNSVNPGYVKTDIVVNMNETKEKSEEVYERSKSVHALERVGEANEVAEVIAFLSSAAASFMTGAIVMVDGGCTAMMRLTSADV